MGNDGIFTLDEFTSRGVVKLAPDALVYIGGGMNINVVSSVGGSNNLSLNDGITNISINNTTETPGSSTASIEISTPIYGETSKYWIEFPGIQANTIARAPLFLPMMEVKVYFKGRFMVKNSKNYQDQPKYYQAFWGFITHVEESFSGGLYKITLQCGDILHWWSYHKINVHPTPESNAYFGGSQPLTFWSTIFKDANVFSVMRSLVELSGEISFVSPAWLGQLNDANFFPEKLFEMIAQNSIMPYWRQRFATIASFLKMYGLGGKLIDTKGVKRVEYEDVVLNMAAQNSQPQEATNTTNKNNAVVEESLLDSFPIFGDLTKLGTFESAEYMTRLEIATEVKNRCDYEFFQDTNGNFVFKPPFYNLDVRGVQPYNIKPNDIINFSMATDVEAVTTVLTVNFPFGVKFYSTTLPVKKGFHMDMDLCKKYGIKYDEVTVNYMVEGSLAMAFAAALMSTKNAKTTSGSITIPGRPEMKMGYPIYVEHKDAFYYVKSISHSFDYGGSFTTTLSFDSERKKIYDYKGQMGQAGGTWSLFPPDLVYRRTPQSLDTAAVTPYDPREMPVTENNDAVNNEIRKMHKAEGHIASMNQGIYELSHRESVEELTVTNNTYPFTDEAGYRLIGAFTYGRGLNPFFLTGQNDQIKSATASKETLMVTKMSSPAYVAEAANMAGLFSKNQEGTVPAYMESIEGVMPTSLGATINVHTTTENAQVTPKEVQAASASTVNYITPGAGIAPGNSQSYVLLNGVPSYINSQPGGSNFPAYTSPITYPNAVVPPKTVPNAVPGGVPAVPPIVKLISKILPI